MSFDLDKHDLRGWAGSPSPLGLQLPYAYVEGLPNPIDVETLFRLADMKAKALSWKYLNAENARRDAEMRMRTMEARMKDMEKMFHEKELQAL